MVEHPFIGAEILNREPQLKAIVAGMLHQQERVDGEGYPNGFKREEIPLAARVISVSDTFGAMTTDRSYRKGLGD